MRLVRQAWGYLVAVNKYRKFLWRYVDYDWSEIYTGLELHLKNLADHIENHKMHVGWERDVHRMRVCQELCKRLAKDEALGYYDAPDEVLRDIFLEKCPEEYWPRFDYEREQATIQYYADYLHYMMAKYSRGWWC
jgi:hypothetical protein